ncbi:histidine kinase [Chryseobacterium hagamense]|nr:histidine kinase [Chryseobacterium hagamense]
MFSSYVGILFFFYLNYFYFIPQLYFRKRYILFVIALIMMFLILDNLPTMIFAHWNGFFQEVKPVGGPLFHPSDIGPPREANKKPIRLPENIFFQFFLIVFISLLLRVSMRLKETETEKLKSEVAYLKAQINPHFLFNVLNSIYALTISKSAEAPDAVLRISSLMRYLTNDSSKDFVPVNDELS